MARSLREIIGDMPAVVRFKDSVPKGERMNEKCPDRYEELRARFFGEDQWISAYEMQELTNLQGQLIAHLREQVTTLRGRLCIYCRGGDVPVNGRHCVTQLSECEPNEFTDERSEVKDYVICPAERDSL